MEDVIAAEHLRTIAHECTAAPIVLDHIAFKKGMGTTAYTYTKMSGTILNGVASQVADTCGVAYDSPVPAVDGESLHGHTTRVLNIHDHGVSPERSVMDAPFLVIRVSRSMLSNHYVVSATAYTDIVFGPCGLVVAKSFTAL